MHPRSSRRRYSHAFSAVELAVTLSIVVILGVLMTVALHKSKVKAQGSKCARQLKSTVLSFKMFAGDNGTGFPYTVTNAPAYQNASNAWLHFQSISNELGSAKILMCPADVARQRYATSQFTKGSNGLATLQNLAVSYFINVDASETNAGMVMLGDRNLVLPAASQNLASLTVTGTTVLRWDADIHRLRGNLARADGSVESVVTSALVWSNNTSVVRLAMP